MKFLSASERGSLILDTGLVWRGEVMTSQKGKSIFTTSFLYLALVLLSRFARACFAGEAGEERRGHQ